MMSLWALCLTAVALVNDCAAQVSTTDPLVVSTNAGTFRGLNSSATVRNWLGIRFGQPTNGTRRFRPPQRADILPSNTIFNATKYSDSCPQNRGSSYAAVNLLSNLGNATDGEDCLSLNIWSPSIDRLNSTSSGAAVLVWFFGGAFTFGTSNTPFYNGNNFVRDQEDLIVVSINYRTTIFGFPVGTDVLSPYSLNLGLFDQRMAVEWVYNNIRAFGGDPSRITLFGESAGSASISTWPYAYQYDPIVQGIILESGSEVSLSAGTAQNVTRRNLAWQTLANASGCALNTSTTASQQLSCMQQVDFSLIQKGLATNAISNGFVPSVDNVTVFPTSVYRSRMATGQLADIPVLIGTNDDEGTLLTALYPPGTISATNLTLTVYTCETANIVSNRRSNNISAWQYRYLAEFPNINALPALGVFHSSEIPLVFGTYNISSSIPSTADEIGLSRTMQGGWSAFARDPRKGLTNYGWPVYSATGNTLIQLGLNNGSTTTFVNSTFYNGQCASAPPLPNRGL